MSISTDRKIVVTLSGDIDLVNQFLAATNTLSPGQVQIVDLSSGNNTITVPSAGSTQATAVTIIPPSGNAVVLTLKGVSGDTGIAIHKTDPTSLGLNSVSTFVLNAASAVAGVRLIYT